MHRVGLEMLRFTQNSNPDSDRIVSSESINSAYSRSKILGKKSFVCTKYVQTFFSFSLLPKQPNNYLPSTYTVLGYYFCTTGVWTQALCMLCTRSYHWAISLAHIRFYKQSRDDLTYERKMGIVTHSYDPSNSWVWDKRTSSSRTVSAT